MIAMVTSLDTRFHVVHVLYLGNNQPNSRCLRNFCLCFISNLWMNLFFNFWRGCSDTLILALLHFVLIYAFVTSASLIIICKKKQTIQLQCITANQKPRRLSPSDADPLA